MDKLEEISKVHKAWLGGFIGPQNAMMQISRIMNLKEANFNEGRIYIGDTLLFKFGEGKMTYETRN